MKLAKELTDYIGKFLLVILFMGFVTTLVIEVLTDPIKGDIYQQEAER